MLQVQRTLYLHIGKIYNFKVLEQYTIVQCLKYNCSFNTVLGAQYFNLILYTHWPMKVGTLPQFSPMMHGIQSKELS